MKSLTFGTIPSDLTIDEPYEMTLNPRDLALVASIVNQGIDSHLQAVFTKQTGNRVQILDSKSMKCFLRRCVENGADDYLSFASSIMTTLGYEWV